MEIRNPKFELGQKVIDKDGNVITVIKFNSYHFEENEYWYYVSYDGETLIKTESYLEPYVEKPKSVWDLKSGDKCYFVTVNGSILTGTWDDNYLQTINRQTGNVFLTEEEAKCELERRKIEGDMLRLGGRRNFKKGERNWFIYYNNGLNVTFFYDSIDQGSIYFDSENEAYNAIKTIGESMLKKYIFGVES